jgi:hypothetical protein
MIKLRQAGLLRLPTIQTILNSLFFRVIFLIQKGHGYSFLAVAETPLPGDIPAHSQAVQFSWFSCDCPGAEMRPLRT